MVPEGVNVNLQYFPSMSPTYAFDTATDPLSPAAVGSACRAFFRPFAATSPMITQPVPDPKPLETVVHVVPELFPSGSPVFASRRYIALPAFGAVVPRLGIEASMSGK